MTRNRVQRYNIFFDYANFAKIGKIANNRNCRIFRGLHTNNCISVIYKSYQHLIR